MFNNEKTLLITGAASGLGEATVRKFSQNPQYLIFATDKNLSIHQTFPPEHYPHVFAQTLDIRDPNQTVETLSGILDTTGRVDVLINNAGVLNSGSLESYFTEDGSPTAEYIELFKTNLEAPVLLTLRVLEQMRTQHSGHIINVTSSSEHNRSPYRKPYADIKAVFAGITKNMAQQEINNGIKVTNIQPGMHKTAIERHIWTVGTNQSDAVASQQLYDWWRNTFGMQPENVAKAIYKVAEGEITDQRVLVGWDTHLTTFLDEHLPFWQELFTFGYNGVLLGVKFGIQLPS